VWAQLKVEDPDDVAEDRLAGAVRRQARGRVNEGLGHSLIGRIAHLAQPSTYDRKAGYLPQRPQDHRRTG
jgi:hypothetical protein